MKHLLYSIFIIAFSMSANSAIAYEIMVADTNDPGFLNEAANSAKMIAARHEFNENNMRGALTMYREIIKEEPNNASAMYWTARCHYQLKKYDLAQEYLENAIKSDARVNKEVLFFYGQILHRLAQLDAAIEKFEEFKLSTSKRSYEYELASEYIQQCKFAKELMSHPVDVEIRNMGNSINSRFDEYAPSITADGKKLVFTSRRSDTKGGHIDEEGDYKFFEDIYYSELEDSKEWSFASGINGDVNTEAHDGVLSISPNGKSLFIFKNDGTAGDIYLSKFDVVSSKWETPEKLPRPINTSYYEGSCSITADGKQLYFISERPDGRGQGDIYMSEKKENGSWTAPKNLGDKINTESDEKFVFIHPNGKTLYFSSNGHQTMGGHDIFKAELVNDQWSIPINLGYPINTVNEESTFSLTKDNNKLLIAAEYDDSFGERDIYEIDVSKYELLTKGYDKSLFGTIIFTVKDGNGKVLKGVNVDIFGKSSEKLIASEKTDKMGLIQISLPGNLTYKFVFEGKKGMGSSEINLELNNQGETVIKKEMILGN